MAKRILHVDMTTQRVSFEDYPEDWKLLGGRSLVARVLLERCDPGTSLCDASEEEQDVIVAGLAPAVADTDITAPVSAFVADDGALEHEAREKADHWIDADLVEEGMRLFEELPRTGSCAAGD